MSLIKYLRVDRLYLANLERFIPDNVQASVHMSYQNTEILQTNDLDIQQ